MNEYEITDTTEGNSLCDLSDCKTIIAKLETQGVSLLEEKNKLEEDFGQQRARLKDLYIQKEEVVKLLGEKNQNLKTENEQKTIMLRHMQEELDNLRSQVKNQNCNSSVFDNSIPENIINISGNSISLQNEPDSSPQLTDDQKRAISGTSSCSSEHLIEPESPKISSNPVIITEGDWLSLQEEITNYQKMLSEECKMCAELKISLKMVETDLNDNLKRKSTSEKAIVRIKLELERVSEYRQKSELKWRQMSEDFERKEKYLQIKVNQVTLRHKELVSAVKEGFRLVYEQSNELTKKRDLVNKELFRLQNENDSLLGKHSICSRELQNEIINLPDSMEDMQLLLLKYREDVIAAKVAKEHIDETLNSKILFLKDQLEAEQHERASLEEKLSREIEQFRQKAAISLNLEEKLQNERQFLLQTEEKLKVSEQKGSDSVTRSQHFITGLKNKIDEQDQKKAQTESIVTDLKARVSSLQQDLKTSEAVQRDFVRLSQSLQVHLEKIRQSDKEVRWQHEDDIEDCNHCNQKFNTIGCRKHHCKHCGKIFCSECVTKTVVSGPNRRPSRVCDVCHTLLVPDAKPFFSIESQHLPD